MFVVPEFVHEDGGRPDLEGHDHDGRPVLVVEAKFGALLEPAQIRSYLSDQAVRLGDEHRGAFVLLVPRARASEAERVLQLAVEAMQGQWRPLDSVGAAVVTWDECIEAMEEAISSVADVSELAGDLVQFRAMCTTLGGLIIPPLGLAAFGSQWREREEDLRQIVREVTSRVVGPVGRFPMGDEAGYEHRRYIPGGDAAPGVCCDVGVGTRFADEGATPFWLRYHRQTPGFTIVKERLLASPHAPNIRTEGRQLWLPLEADPDAAGPDLVKALTAQVADIISAASTQGSAGAPNSEHRTPMSPG